MPLPYGGLGRLGSGGGEEGGLSWADWGISWFHVKAHTGRQCSKPPEASMPSVDVMQVVACPGAKMWWNGCVAACQEVLLVARQIDCWRLLVPITDLLLCNDACSARGDWWSLITIIHHPDGMAVAKWHASSGWHSVHCWLAAAWHVTCRCFGNPG